MFELKLEKMIQPLMSGDPLIDAIKFYPDYDEYIRNAEKLERLGKLSDIYKIYHPFQLSVEIYNKLYLSTVLSLKKKNTKLAVRQRNDTYRSMLGDKQYHGIIGGADSLTIIGPSGIGKSSAIQAALNLISGGRIIEVDNPYIRIIPCLTVECPFDASPKALLLEILRNVDKAIDTTYYEKSQKSSDTTDILIGKVSQVSLNNIGILVIDEIQNIWGRKNGTALMSMLIQLINSSGISIAMSGTDECVPFFERAAQLARRAQGLRYNALEYDSYFEDFCRIIWKYQYTAEYTPIDVMHIDWLFQFSGGIISNVVSLIHDAQEIAILDGYEKLDIISLDKAYKSRLSFMHGFIEAPKKVAHPKVVAREEIFEEKDLGTYQSIPEIVAEAKRKGADLLDYLFDHIHIEEVPL